MDFAFSEDQLAIKESVAKLCAQFDGKYWLKKDKEGGFPEAFSKAMAAAGWRGSATHQERGGHRRSISTASRPPQSARSAARSRRGAACPTSSRARSRAASPSPNPMP